MTFGPDSSNALRQAGGEADRGAQPHLAGGLATKLTGRHEECRVLEQLLAAVRQGASRALVLRGDPGVGKTALLRHLMDRATGFRIAHARASQDGTGSTLTALRELTASMLEHLDALPVGQRDALSAALVADSGAGPNHFLLALAAQGLLTAAAEHQPLLCVIDDYQRIDRGSGRALAFAARRLETGSVGIVFATRNRSDDLRGLPELVVGGLSEHDAKALLDAALTAPLDPDIRDQLVGEARGNPLALLDLARGASPAAMAGGFGLPVGPPLPPGFRASFGRRLALFPPESRRLALLAAADPTGEPRLLWRAARGLAIPSSAAAPLARAGLLEVGARARFLDPLARSAAYLAASASERRRAHRALAEAIDPETDPDRRAWHMARSVSGPDEEVADQLESSAPRAQVRGGLLASAAFLRRAAELTADPNRRARRILSAAVAARDSGMFETVVELLASVDMAALDARSVIECERLRGQIAFDEGRVADAARLLSEASRRYESIDGDLARETLLQAVGAATWAGDLTGLSTLRSATAVAGTSRRAHAGERPVDALLDAYAIRLTDGYAKAERGLREALRKVLNADVTPAGTGPWLWLAGSRIGGILAVELWDIELAQELAERHALVARRSGALVHLQYALNFGGWIRLVAGDLVAATRMVDEDLAIADATGNRAVGYTKLALAAWSGQEDATYQLVEAARASAAVTGMGSMLTYASYAASLLDNGLGRHDSARVAAIEAFTRDQVGYGPLVLPELAEAAARAGDIAMLREAAAWISARTGARTTPWMLGIEARVHALMGAGATAERHYRESIEHLNRAPIRVELARGHLLYGEWLRRQRRRSDARKELRTAYRMLAHMGIEAFAQRARRELAALGETFGPLGAQPPKGLTAQELKIAQLARLGFSNPEIAARLFISPRTVQYHLRKVFGKLGISSRSELAYALWFEATDSRAR